MKKFLATIMMITLFSALLTGCSGAGNSSSAAPSQSESAAASESETAAGSEAESTGSAATGDLEKFSIVLDWYPNAVHTFLYVAKEKGYFAEEGLDVDIIFPTNDNDALTLPAAGKADAGLYYMNYAIMTRIQQNVPIKVIGSVVAVSQDIILSLKDKNITSPADLDGKILGYSDSILGEAIIGTLLEESNIPAENVTMINVGFDLMSSMTTGNVDATYGCVINHEVPQMEKEGFEVNYFALTDYGVPQYYGLSMMAGEKALADNPEKYERFMRACKKGFEDMKADPAASLQILLDNQDESNFPLDKDVETKSLDMLLGMMETDTNPFLYQDPAVFETNIKWLNEKGLIDKVIETDEIMGNLEAAK